jgi:hypothetical protein
VILLKRIKSILALFEKELGHGKDVPWAEASLKSYKNGLTEMSVMRSSGLKGLTVKV